ncbi:hypothetical protein [Actinoallomurus bryophytorum]|nr:hypothetical protein [Actinoallomurus bryophytorum]
MARSDPPDLGRPPNPELDVCAYGLFGPHAAGMRWSVAWSSTGQHNCGAV